MWRQRVSDNTFQISPTAFSPCFNICQFAKIFITLIDPYSIAIFICQFFNSAYIKLIAIYTNICWRIRCNTITIYVLRFGTNRSMHCRFINSISIYFFDHAFGVRNHHAAGCRRRCSNIFFIKRRCPRSALSIKRIRSNLISELSFI